MSLWEDKVLLAKFNSAGVRYNPMVNTLHPPKITEDIKFVFSLAGKKRK
jgi:hypothetical protein